MTKHGATGAVLLAGWLCSLAVAALGGETATARKRPYVMPVSIPASNGPPIAAECEIRFGPTTPVTALAFGPGGRALAVGGYKEVLLWDLANCRLAGRLGTSDLSGAVRALVYAKDSKSLIVGGGSPGATGEVRILDLETGRTTAKLAGPKDEVFALALSADGKLLAAGGADTVVYVWRLPDKKLVASLKDHTDWVTGIAFHPDAKSMATAGSDRMVLVWEVGAWKTALRFSQSEPVHSTAFSPEGDFLAWTYGGEKERGIRVRRMVEDQPAPVADPAKPRRQEDAVPIRTIDTGAGVPLGVAWKSPPPSAQGKASRTNPAHRLFAPCTDRTVKVFTAGNGVFVTNLLGHTDWVCCAALSPDGARLASGSADGTVKLWSISEARPLATLAQLAPATDEWVILTAQGFFTASAPEALRWKAGKRSYAPGQLSAALNKPWAVQRALAGGRVPPPLLP